MRSNSEGECETSGSDDGTETGTDAGGRVGGLGGRRAGGGAGAGGSPGGGAGASASAAGRGAARVAASRCAASLGRAAVGLRDTTIGLRARWASTAEAGKGSGSRGEISSLAGRRTGSGASGKRSLNFRRTTDTCNGLSLVTTRKSILAKRAD